MLGPVLTLKRVYSGEWLALLVKVGPDPAEDVVARGDRRLLRALNHRALVRLHEERERVPHRHLALALLNLRHAHAVKVGEEPPVGPPVNKARCQSNCSYDD